MKKCLYLICNIILIVSVGCVKSEPLSEEEATYSTSEKLSELTNVQFPEVKFIDGVKKETGSLASTMSYKVIFSHSDEKDAVVEKINELLRSKQSEWSQSDSAYSFHSDYTIYGIRKNYPNTLFLVDITIPKDSNDTIYISQRVRDTYDAKNRSEIIE